MFRVKSFLSLFLFVLSFSTFASSDWVEPTQINFTKIRTYKGLPLAHADYASVDEAIIASCEVIEEGYADAGFFTREEFSFHCPVNPIVVTGQFTSTLGTHYIYGNGRGELRRWETEVIGAANFDIYRDEYVRQGCPASHPTSVDFELDGTIDLCLKEACSQNEATAIETRLGLTPGTVGVVGNPIQCSTGQKTQTDIVYQGTGSDPLSYTTHYASPKFDETSSTLGQWFNSLQGNQRKGNHSRKVEQIYNQNGGKLFKVSYKSGFSHMFYGATADIQLKNTSSKSGSFKIETDGSFTQTMPSGTVYSFDSAGLLTTKTLANGKTRTYTYTPTGKLSTVTNHYGQQLKYFYNGQDLLSKLIDPEKRETFFEYDANQNLTKIIYPDDTPANLSDNPSMTYLFENINFPNHLTGKINEKGIRLATWNYDINGRAISSEHGVSLEKVELDYSVANQTRVTTHVSDTLSNDLIYHYSTRYIGGRFKKLLDKYEQITCIDCAVGSWVYGYDANGYVSKSTSPAGAVTTFIHDADGLETSRTEAVGTPDEKTYTTVWDKATRQVLSVASGNLKTEYGYDTQGQRTTTTLTDLTSLETRTTTINYGVAGLVDSIDGARTDVNDVTSFTYDLLGNVSTITNALGHVTTFENYDASRRVGMVTDANGMISTMTYTPRGWLAASTVNGALTQYDYLPTGSVKTITAPSGQTINYEYDDGERLIAIVDSLGNRMEYVRDLMGNVTNTNIKDSGGFLKRTQTAVFNALGQLKQSLGNNGQSSLLTYDADGNPVTNTNAKNNATTTSFDALNRLKKTVDSDLAETNFTYDNQDNLTSVTDAEGKVTSYEYNAFGEQTKLTSQDTGVTSFTYDSAGNLLTKTDAKGITVTFTYDALNRVLTQSYLEPSENVAYIYDDTTNANKGIGRLTSITDESGSTAYEYNLFGQVAKETKVISGQTYVTEYLFDTNGRLTEVTYPSGRKLTYSFDGLSRLSGLSTTQNSVVDVLASDMSYLPFGPMENITYGNGTVINNTFDTDYRLTDTSDNLQVSNYQYDITDNISTITDSAITEHNQTFGYDNINRLMSASSVADLLGYEYDGVGNRSAKNNSGIESYTYDTQSHHLLSKELYIDQESASISNKLVAELNFKSNPTVIDLINGLNAEAFGSVGMLSTQKADGTTGDVYQFNDTGATGVKMPYDSRLNLNKGTVSVWVKTFGKSQYQFIVAKNYAWGIRLKNNQLHIYDYITGIAQSAGPNLNDGLWHHLVLSFESGVTNGTNLYVDGVNVLTTTHHVQNHNVQVTVGTADPSGSWHNVNGLVENVAIFDDILTPEEVSYLYELKNSKSVTELQTTNFTYDPNGNTTQKGDMTFAYNQANRMSGSVNGTTSAKYTYNAKGERSIKVVNDGVSGVETHYIFDLNGQLIAEADALGVIQKEYVYLNGQPFAQIIGSDIYYYHNSHLGTPEIMTDANQTIVWQASYTPFGKATVSVNAVENNIRFPGQYFDSETNLHYNYFRDYDPEIGRYIQSDPIGLAGGINTYGYVGGNPVNAIDPLGLELIIVGQSGGAGNMFHLAAQTYDRENCECNEIVEVGTGDEFIQAVESYAARNGGVDGLQYFGHSSNGALYVNQGAGSASLYSNLWVEANTLPGMPPLVLDSGAAFISELDPSLFSNTSGINLRGCNAGWGTNSIASELARILGTSVRASNGPTNFSAIPNGAPGEGFANPRAIPSNYGGDVYMVPQNSNQSSLVFPRP